jgi:hypothetical protein
MRRLLPQTTAATVLLGAALFVSATGGAVAGSVITGKQIKNGTVTTKDIKDQSLLTGDLSADTVTALTGQTGATGAPGAPGAPGLSALQVITVTKTGIAVGENDLVRIDCPIGTALLSADAEWIYRTEAIQVGRPSANLRVAFAFYDNTGGHANEQVALTALCAKVAA